MAPAPEAQLAWFSAALQELPAFLGSSDVFRPLHPPPSGMAQDLSLGGLLLVSDSLSVRAASFDPLRRGECEKALRQWESLHADRAAAVSAKATAEIPHRLNLWLAYLQDLAEKPAAASDYSIEVRHRVLLDRLGEMASATLEGKRAMALEAADRDLRSHLRGDAFVWDAPLAGAYPRQRFWYLYGRPVAAARV